MPTGGPDPLPIDTQEIAEAFAPDREWAQGLPGPSGLALSPGPGPILDQVARLAGEGVQSVTTLAPYYDDDGDALAAVARRFQVTVTCLVQRGREGLSKRAAARLPPNVNLASVDCPDGLPAGLIHAKVMAFHRAADTVLAVGSANCSRAALLASSGSGNAELVAVGPVSKADAEAFLGGLALADGAHPCRTIPHRRNGKPTRSIRSES